MTDSLKTVWVLGAGFSKGLGGPLLNEFFTQRSRMDLELLYKDVRFSGGRVREGHQPDWSDSLFEADESAMVYNLFSFGTGHPEGWVKNPGTAPTVRGARIWADAEEFLDYLDAEAREESTLGNLWNLLNVAQGNPDATPRPDKLAHTARRLLAAQSCGFLQRKPVTLEAWEPYLQWAASLRENDTVLSFNYDTVVERAAEHAAAELHGRGVQVFCGDLDGQAHRSRAGQIPVLVKLHGSVDWRRRQDGNLERLRDRPEYAVEAAPDELLALATPGPSKKELVEGAFAPLWQVAEKALEGADTVVFLGYRFPPSDAQARGRILGALARNAREDGRRDLVVQTVLGADDASASRVAHMVEHVTAGQGRDVRVEKMPLFVEDYLGIRNLL